MAKVVLGTNLPKNYGRRLAIKIDKETAPLLALELAKFAKKSAKLRAPRDTTFMAESIGYEMVNEKEYLIGVFGAAGRYAKFIEEGFTGHYIPVQYIELHEMNPGTIGSRELMRGLGYKGSPSDTGKIPTFVYVSGEARPFLAPAIDSAFNNIEVLGIRAVTRSLGGGIR